MKFVKERGTEWEVVTEELTVNQMVGCLIDDQLINEKNDKEAIELNEKFESGLMTEKEKWDYVSSYGWEKL